MVFDHNERMGFAPPPSVRTRGHPYTAVAQLITSATLVLSIAVAAIAVSIGIPPADGFLAVAEDSNAHVAVLLALVLVGMGGLTAWMTSGRASIKARD